MFHVIKELFGLLSTSQRRRFYRLQILVILMALSEIISVASIIPFMSLVGDITQLQKNAIIFQAYEISGITSELDFVFLLGVGVLLILIVSASVSMFTVWRLSMFGNKVGSEIADRLYSHYLSRDWLFHSSGSSAQLTKKIAIETQRVTKAVISPLLQMNARLVLSFLMCITLFAFDPKVAIIGLIVFAVAYFMLYKLVRLRLQANGRAISEVNEQRFRLMNEGFGGVKDILLLGRGNDFIKRFSQAGYILAHTQGTTSALTQVPRYFIELVAFGSIITLVLYLINNHDGQLGTILPILSVYALAGFKLLPAFQQIYASISGIKASMAAFESIQQDLSDSVQEDSVILKLEKSYLYPKQQISLENITFTYPNKVEPALTQLSMAIPTNSVVGLVGPSGSGKSTLIDIILGLIVPQQGKLKIDNTFINAQNRRSYQNCIGFVAQSIFLSEGTIAQNVAFGIPDEEIDFEQVQKVLDLAHLGALVQGFEKGIYTKVGERGVQLSGGQRQRIGIARALYLEAEILVFDEATSSLDGITEKIIMEAIKKFIGKKTIIIVAHRLKTVQKCDQIFFIDQGKVVDKGTYQELIETNKNFKKMAANA